MILKRLFLFAILICTGCLLLNAQIGSLGIKGGLNFSYMTIEDLDDQSMKPGFHAGVFKKFPVSEKFAIQPEVLYSTKGVKAVYDEEFLGVSIFEGETDFALNYIDIPLYLVYNLAEDLNFHLGPYVGILLGANVDTQAEVLDFINIDDNEELDRDHFNNTDFGISGGLGFQLSFVELGFNYNLGLSQVAPDDDVSEILLGDARNNVIQIYAGIIF
ncbi:MAG: porin family protein [Bacteroidota bacterium]